jgi:hypothetical protein
VADAAARRGEARSHQSSDAPLEAGDPHGERRTASRSPLNDPLHRPVDCGLKRSFITSLAADFRDCSCPPDVNGFTGSEGLDEIGERACCSGCASGTLRRGHAAPGPQRAEASSGHPPGRRPPTTPAPTTGGSTAGEITPGPGYTTTAAHEADYNGQHVPGQEAGTQTTEPQ